MYVYFCKECNGLTKRPDNNASYFCTKCNSKLYSLNKTVEQWNVLTPEEMERTVNDACLPKQHEDKNEKEQESYIQKPVFPGNATKEIQKPDFSEDQSKSVPLPQRANNKIEDSKSSESKTQSSSSSNFTVTKKDDPLKKKLFTFACIFYVLAAITMYKGIDKMVNYSNSEYSFGDHHNAYVGGDAYNYIINSGFSTGFFTLTAGFTVTGTILLGIGILISRMPEVTVVGATVDKKENYGDLVDELPDL